jgi:integrase
LKSLGRSAAEKMIKSHLLAIAEGEVQTLSSHSLRKTWARRLYELSGHDILLVRDGLGHSSVDITQRYLTTKRERLDEMVLRSDWTRAPRKSVSPLPKKRVHQEERTLRLLPTPERHTAAADWLPGFEALAV